MGKGRKRIYEAALEGATAGLSEKELYDFTVKRFQKVTSKKTVRVSVLVLSDAAVTDSSILRTISTFAVEHRLKQLGIANGCKKNGMKRRSSSHASDIEFGGDDRTAGMSDAKQRMRSRRGRQRRSTSIAPLPAPT
ncbi:hypothetical protein GFL78_11685 [Rhizobium leguminosarum bv. viciae]|jgi:hypothetical protein|nr:hypothetical protein [Rhizobium leguminosarum bv. viciae]TBD11502.1 hypothetical protein ELH20_35210 [Rhizobium ruizarguesonis]NKL30758.1 hypothetical protein [Rhizobium leguminosarum bv. viciae]NKL41846.1 hypothetical protein [Rhizobium leguminosarum bv. viciae]TBY60429.1 hypothetical protein E0H46_31225 [Rhizobium leguminosarum bv. viciae]